MLTNADKALLRTFGAAVRQRRQASGLSQEDLAERADLHRTYVGGLERGERNVGLLNVARLAKALGVTVAELVEDLGHPPS